MSIDIMNRIWWREDLPTMEKFVAIALADSAGDTGVCWPAVETIARKCSCSRRTVQNALNGLEGKRLLRRVMRTDTSSYYIFNLDHLPHVERPRNSKEVGPHDAHLPRAGDAPGLFDPAQEMHPPHESGSIPRAGDAPRTVIEPSIEPSESMSDHAVVERWQSRWDQFASEVPGFGKLLTFSETRAKHLLKRVDEFALNRDPAKVDALFDTIFERIAGSRFLRGDKTDWKVPGCDWVLNRTNFNKIMEGSYVQDFTDGAALSAAGARPGDRSHMAAGQAALSILQQHRERSGRGDQLAE